MEDVNSGNLAVSISSKIFLKELDPGSNDSIAIVFATVGLPGSKHSSFSQHSGVFGLA